MSAVSWRGIGAKRGGGSCKPIPAVPCQQVRPLRNDTWLQHARHLNEYMWRNALAVVVVVVVVLVVDRVTIYVTKDHHPGYPPIKISNRLKVEFFPLDAL